MSQISSIALSGLQQAAQTINESAEAISKNPDLGNADDIIQLKQAETSFKANAKVIEIDKKLDDRKN